MDKINNSTEKRKQVAIPMRPARDLVQYLEAQAAEEVDVTDGDLVVSALISLWERSPAEQQEFIAKAQTYWKWRREHGSPAEAITNPCQQGMSSGSVGMA